MRSLTYVQAIREAHAQLLATDPRVFVIGQGVWSPWYAGTSLLDLDREFGRSRIIDSPVSESAITGVAIGAALDGMRPILFHPRMDFMLLATDAIVNQAANWSYMFGGQIGVPLVIRAAINRGGEQGAQHSQAFQVFFAHVPGMKVVLPSTPHDAKGLLVSAVNDGNPVLYIDDRWLYQEAGEVPEELYRVPIGRAAVRREGKDLTIAGSSYMMSCATRAASMLAGRGVDVELIDLRSVKPWDRECVCESVEKTGRLLVVDSGWVSFGLTAEIAATVASEVFGRLKAPVARIGLPDAPAPTSRVLEKAYYPDEGTIIAAAVKLLAE